MTKPNMGQWPDPLSVYVITDPMMLQDRSIFDVVESIFATGVLVVQLRDKEASTRSLVQQARRLVRIAERYGGQLLVNDRIDVALSANAHGVHVGADDMSVADARRLLGPKAVVGRSVATIQEAWQAKRDGADYVAASHIFPTATKKIVTPPMGIEGLERLCEGSPLPVVGIGGIGPENAADVIAAGATGVSVVSAVMAAPDVTSACRALLDAAAAGRARRRG